MMETATEYLGKESSYRRKNGKVPKMERTLYVGGTKREKGSVVGVG